MPEGGAEWFFVGFVAFVGVRDVQRANRNLPKALKVARRDFGIFRPSIACEGDRIANEVIDFVLAHQAPQPIRFGGHRSGTPRIKERGHLRAEQRFKPIAVILAFEFPICVQHLEPASRELAADVDVLS